MVPANPWCDAAITKRTGAYVSNGILGALAAATFASARTAHPLGCDRRGSTDRGRPLAAVAALSPI